ncbi:hypothetical protein [Spirosoma koreense]
MYFSGKIKNISFSIILLMSFSCKENDTVYFIDNNKFVTNKYKNILAFDLGSDDRLVSAVIISNKTKSQRNTLILPFEIKNSEKQSKLFNSWSVHLGSTIIDYSLPLHNGDERYIINISPRWSSSLDETNSIYWQSLPATNRFIYKHYRNPDSSLISSISKQVESIDAIAISLPEEAKVFEERNLSKEIIKPDFEQNEIRFFEINTIKANNSELKIEYTLKPPLLSNETIKDLIKFLATIAFPLIIIFLNKAKVPVNEDEKRKRRILKYAFLSIEVLILIIVGILGYLSWRQGKGIPILDITSIFTGSLLQYFVTKTESK